jgi:hypothetical protein
VWFPLRDLRYVHLPVVTWMAIWWEKSVVNESRRSLARTRASFPGGTTFDFSHRCW